jgi:leader peptidase (prepilin peptidase)/N-methyltransferase
VNAALAIPATLLAAGAFWVVAARTLRRRGLDAGAFPVRSIAFAGIAGGIVAHGASAATGTCVAVAACMAAAVLDARTGLVVDTLTGTFALVAGTAAAVDGVLVPAALGAAATSGVLLGLHVVTARRGIGLGDVKLATGIGAALGPERGLLALAAAFAVGGAYAAWLLACGGASRGTPIRFAPFLATGVVAALAWSAPR